MNFRAMEVLTSVFASRRPGTNTMEMNEIQATPTRMASIPTDLPKSLVFFFDLGFSFIVQYSVKRISQPMRANSPVPPGRRQSDRPAPWREDGRSEFDTVDV